MARSTIVPGKAAFSTRPRPCNKQRNKLWSPGQSNDKAFSGLLSLFSKATNPLHKGPRIWSLHLWRQIFWHVWNTYSVGLLIWDWIYFYCTPFCWDVVYGGSESSCPQKCRSSISQSPHSVQRSKLYSEGRREEGGCDVLPLITLATCIMNLSDILWRLLSPGEAVVTNGGRSPCLGGQGDDAT